MSAYQSKSDTRFPDFLMIFVVHIDFFVHVLRWDDLDAYCWTHLLFQFSFFLFCLFANCLQNKVYLHIKDLDMLVVRKCLHSILFILVAVIMENLFASIVPDYKKRFLSGRNKRKTTKHSICT